MKGVLSSDVIGRLQDRRASGQEILDSWSLTTAILGLCRLLFVLDTIQTQVVKNQLHYRLYLQISRAPEERQYLEVQACAVTACVCMCV